MSDYGKFKLGGVEFPVPASPFVGALQALDPGTHAALAFFKAMLQAHLGAYFNAAVAAANVPDLVGKIVAECVGYDPTPYLTSAQYKFPLLAAYRTEETVTDKTVAWHRTTQRWTLLYVLPPLTAAQANQLVPILKGVRSVIVDRTAQGYDPAYQSSAEVWAACGLAEIGAVSARYGTIPDVQTNLPFPALEMTLEVVEQEGATPGLDTLAGIDATIAVSDGDPASEVSVAQIAWENVTP